MKHRAPQNTAETLGAIFKKREETKPNEEAIKTVFLTGGTAYITATFLRAQQVGQNPTGKLTLPIAEIKAFSESLQNAASIADVFDARLPKGAPDDAVVANYIRAKGIYDLDRLRAGAWMLSSTLEYVQLKYPNVKEVVYDGNGLFAWMKGYLQNAKKKADGPTTSDVIDQLKNSGRTTESKLQDIRIGLEGIATLDKNLADRFQKLQDQLTVLEKLTSAELQLTKIAGSLEKSSSTSLTKEDLQNTEKALVAALARINLATAGAGAGPMPTSPGNPLLMRMGDALYQDGVQAYQRRAWAGALAFFQLSVEQTPNDPLVWYHKAIVELTLNDCVAAEDSIRTTARLLNASRLNETALSRSLEHAQGSARQRAEKMLRLAMTKHFSEPK